MRSYNQSMVFVLALVTLLFSMASSVSSHSGRTDGSGGHNCSAKSIAKGLCTGYHYHNRGSVSAPTYAPVVTAKPVTPKPATPEPTLAQTTQPIAVPVVLGIYATTEATASPIGIQTIEPTSTPLVASDKDENPIVGLGILGVLVYGVIKFLAWREKRLKKDEISIA